LLAYKPQLGVLVPIALAAAGLWRCIAAAFITAAGIALAASALFGWHIWADWLAYLPSYADQFDRESTQIRYLMPTLTATLQTMGVSPSIIRPLQAALATASAVWIWRACRDGITPRAVLVIACGSLLATPHAFVYDLPLLTGAVLLFGHDRASTARGLVSSEVAALVLALVFPALMAHLGHRVPLGLPCLALLAAALIAAAKPARPAVRA